MDKSNTNDIDLSDLKIDRSKRSNSPHSRKKWLHLLWILLPILLYFVYQITLEKVASAIKLRTTTVELVTGSEAAADLVATGYVVAQIKASVASKASGRLATLNVEEGDKVLKGDILAILDNDDILAFLDLAKANLKSARADSVAALLNYNRQKDLSKNGHISEDILETATARYQISVASVEAAAARLRSAKVDLNNTYIKAPFDGTILLKNADVGEMVAPFASSSSSRGAVVTMADMSSLEVEADVSESNIYKVIVGSSCEIVLDAYPHYKYPAYVKKIIPTADRSRATVKIKIAFREIDDRVLPEMSARVNFLSQDIEEQKEIEPLIAVNRKAITIRNGDKVVYKIVDSYAIETSVEVGRELGAITEILSGLEVGEQVILSPPGNLQSGDKVEAAN